MSELTTFLFDGLPVRGVLVRLDDAWQEVLRRREAAGGWPPELRVQLGEMTAAAVLMQASIRFKGALVIQIFGDGPARLAVAEVQPDLALRATAKVVGDVAPGSGFEALFNLHGQGRCAITLDPQDRRPGQQPYQGVVPLHGDRHQPLQHMSEAIEHYMRQSEQLETRLVLAADEHVAAGLLIQRLPQQGAGNLGGARADDDGDLAQAYQRIAMLAGTLTRDELLTLPGAQVLHRLFWQERLAAFAPRTPRFACRCSGERVRGMLRTLGRAESEGLIEERGVVEVGCDYCGAMYRYDAVDVGEMFTPQRDQPPTPGAVQ